MRENDEFDIIEEDEAAERASRTWLWIGAIALVALFAFGVGAAFVLVSNRLGESEPLITPTPVSQAVLTLTRPVQATPPVTATLTVIPTAAATQTATPRPTATLTPTVTPTAELACSQPVEDVFVPLYSQAELGCAQGAAAVVWAAWEPFERGYMLWRADNDTSYVFFADGRWEPVQERWDGGPAADRGAPPPGLQAPVRGFGYVWSRSDAVFGGLGWATDQEKGFCAAVQIFDKGFILRSVDVPSCTAEGLFNQATSSDWSPVLLAAGDDGRWRNVPAADVPAEDGGERPQGTLTRPAAQGIFDAPRLDGLVVDARFREWQERWIPINAIVFGLDNHRGPGDLSANFQVGWLDDGLALAVRVNDDRNRAGPEGTDLWQGDGLEIQFDRQLAGDFTSPQADGDDYQIGIAFDRNLTSVRGYRWLPFAEEGALSLPAALRATDQGYALEVLIPWAVFGLNADAVSTGTAYGFNLSVNDNDGQAPAQQTVASASVARTTHDNPTEWGTLRLLP